MRVCIPTVPVAGAAIDFAQGEAQRTKGTRVAALTGETTRDTKLAWHSQLEAAGEMATTQPRKSRVFVIEVGEMITEEVIIIFLGRHAWGRLDAHRG